MTQSRLILGDCVDEMRRLPEASIDAIVTDPPYGLGFMGKKWDALPPGREWAEECLRVLKPGGHLLAFGGTRTYHRLAVAVEDAGFEVRDCIFWLYGSGFPKSKNLDGAWDGWGTALKPACEPIIVARKALSGTVAATVAEHGTGALNIDACRIGLASGEKPYSYPTGPKGNTGVGAAFDGRGLGRREEPVEGSDAGRWPANVALDEEAAALLDAQTGTLKSGKMQPTHTEAERAVFGQNVEGGYTTMETYGDSGGASRFFYVAKPSRKERDAGLDAFVERKQAVFDRDDVEWATSKNPYCVGGATAKRNVHPTVKPIEFMRWLVRLVTPPGGVVLDPFLGSGTTGIAAALEGFDFMGIEREAEYLDIARARIEHWREDETPVEVTAPAVEPEPEPPKPKPEPENFYDAWLQAKRAATAVA